MRKSVSWIGKAKRDRKSINLKVKRHNIKMNKSDLRKKWGEKLIKLPWNNGFKRKILKN